MAKYKKDSKGYYRAYEVYQGITIDLRSKDPAELERKLRQKKNDIDSGYDSATGQMKVSTWAQKWLATYKRGKVVAKNYDTCESNLRNHILPYIGDMALGSVLPYHLQEVLNRQEGKSESHIDHVKNALTGMFREAKNNNFILTDPSIGLIVPKGTRNTHRALTPAEEKTMFKVCQNGHRAAPLVYLMYYAGLRPQEASALLVGDIDLKAPCIHITKATEMVSGSTKGTKSNAGQRDVPVCKTLLTYLKTHLQGKAATDYVITDTRGEPLTENTIRPMWKNLRRAMSIEMGARVYRNRVIDSPLAKDFVPYNLRHTYCTNLQRAGIPINIAKYLMGHDDISVTAKIYTHFTEDQAGTVLEKMNAYIS